MTPAAPHAIAAVVGSATAEQWAEALRDPEAGAALERITRLVAAALEVPVAIIGVAVGTQQVVRSHMPELALLAPDGTLPLADTICRHVLTSDAVVTIPDFRLDARGPASPCAVAAGLASYLGVPLCTAAGEIIGSVCVGDHVPRAWTALDIALVQDIATTATTELTLRATVRDAQEQARKATAMERKYVDFVQQLDAIVWEADIDTLAFTFVSDRAETMLGYPVARWLDDPGFWPSIIHPDDRAWAVRFCTEATARNENHTFEYRAIAADGRIVWLHDTVRIASDPRPGAPRRVNGVMIDVTERALAAEAQRAQELLFRRVTENMADIVALLDLDGTVQYMSPSMQRVFGFDPAVLLGQDALALVHPDDVAPMRARFAVVARGEGGVLQTIRMRNATGAYRWLEVLAQRVLDERGQLVQLQVTGRDVTERRIADERLADSERRYRATFRANPHPMWVCDRETLDFLDVNDAAVAHYGWSREQFLRMTLRDIRPSTEQALLDRHPVEVHEGQQVIPVSRHLTAGGNLIEVEIARHDLDFGGRAAMLLLATDVTERRRVAARLREREEEMRQSQKMEAVGRLAGGVAHDFNNLLTVIRCCSEMLLEELPPGMTGRDDALEIKRTADRAVSLTRQLLAFSRKQVMQPKVLDLNGVVDGLDGLLRRLVHEDIELVALPGAALGRIRADPGQIEQVLVNLVVNARDAMPAGGASLIETANLTLMAPLFHPHGVITPGAYVTLSVSDTGVGMDAETRSHVFEPFFTTKGPGQGTGLGLSTVYGIVKQSGGHVTFRSEQGHGTAFTIYFPRLEDDEAGALELARATLPPHGTETVLLVEDEQSLRVLARRILQKHGYTVLEARHGADALLLLGKHPTPVHLVVTDVVMPEMGGAELVDRLRDRYPDVRVLVMSGYTDDEFSEGTAERRVRAPRAAFLEKPFTADVLARRVREVLDAA